MPLNQERELCWIFNQKRQIWQEVFIHAADWDGTSDKVDLTYSKDPTAKVYSMLRSNLSRTLPEELEGKGESEGAEHVFLIKKPYFDAIKDGKKTWEGRLHDMKARKIKVGDFLVFNKRLHKRVAEKKTFSSFKEMINEIGVSALLPECKSVEEGVEIYRTYPNYRDTEERYGAIAFRLEAVSDMPTPMLKTRAGLKNVAGQPAAKKPRVDADEDSDDAPLM